MKQKLINIYYILKSLRVSQINQFFFSVYQWARSGFRVSKLAESRLEICKACPHYEADQCKLCGCYTPLKTKWFTEECPIEKW